MNHKRNYGIDCLRIVSMLYIVMIHFVVSGGIAGDTVSPSLQVLSTTVQLLTICTVNCFGLISGYVGYSDTRRSYRFHSYFSLWLEVAFYNLVPYLLFFFLGDGSITWKDCLKALFPLTTNTYWYFTAYTPLFFLMPLINESVRHSSRRQLVKLCLILAVVFSYLSISGDGLRLHGGYTFAWLLYLYLVGATLKKCGIPQRISSGKAFLAILVLWLLRVLWSLYGPAWNIFIFTIHRSQSNTHTAISTLLLAVLHLIAFSGLKLPDRLCSVIRWAAPCTFSIYLLNTQPLLWQHIVVGRFAEYVDGNIGVLAIRLVVLSCGFVVASLLIDFLRQKLFRLLRIDTLIQKLVQLGNNAANQLLKFE